MCHIENGVHRSLMNVMHSVFAVATGVLIIMVDSLARLLQEDAEDDQQDNAITPSNNEENSAATAVARDQEALVVDNLGASQ